MLVLRRTYATNPQFQDLVTLLDDELAILDGEDHSFYHQLNTIGNLRFVVLALKGDQPVGCGAIREFDELTMEVKRMYVTIAERGQGIATRILAELENWAREMRAERCVLETGKRQPDAIALYTKCGYRSIPNYGQYAQMENSVCFEKKL